MFTSSCLIFISFAAGYLFRHILARRSLDRWVDFERGDKCQHTTAICEECGVILDDWEPSDK